MIRKRVALSNEDIGVESITQPAISARITEARYDDQNLGEIMKDDFVCLLDGRHVMNEHEDEKYDTFLLRNFDKPTNYYSDFSNSAMVKLDPNYRDQEANEIR